MRKGAKPGTSVANSLGQGLDMLLCVLEENMWPTATRSIIITTAGHLPGNLLQLHAQSF